MAELVLHCPDRFKSYLFQTDACLESKDAKEAEELLRLKELEYLQKVLQFNIGIGKSYLKQYIRKFSTSDVLSVEYCSFNKKESGHWVNAILFNEDQYGKAITDSSLSKYKKPKKSRRRVYLESNMNDELLYTAYLIDRTIAAYGSQVTDCIYGDIDEENGLEIYLKRIRPLLGKPTELMIELSVTGRLHFCVKSKYNLNDTFLEELRNIIRDNLNIHFDIRTSKQAMVLPDSHRYKSGYLRDGRFIPFANLPEKFYYQEKMIQTLSQSPDTIQSVDTKNIFELYSNNTGVIKEYLSFINQTTGEDNNCISNECEDEGSFVDQGGETCESIVNQQPLYIRKKRRTYNSVKEKLYHGFPFGRGNRYERMKEIISFGIRNNFSLEECFEAFESNHDGTSKDLTKWPINRRRKVVEDCFINMEKKYKEEYRRYCKPADEHNRGFISNINLIPQELLPGIERVSKIIYAKQIKPTLKKEYWKREYIRATELVVKEIIGFSIYNYNTPRNKSEKKKISYKKFKDINRGFQISRKYLFSLKDHYGLKIDVLHLFNIVTHSSIFKQLTSGKTGYSSHPEHSYCRQWTYIDFNDNLEDACFHKALLLFNRNDWKATVGNIRLCLKGYIKRNCYNTYSLFRKKLEQYTSSLKMIRGLLDKTNSICVNLKLIRQLYLDYSSIKS